MSASSHIALCKGAVGIGGRPTSVEQPTCRRVPETAGTKPGHDLNYAERASERLNAISGLELEWYRVRLLEGFIPEPNSGCWLWLGQVNDSGYGRLGHRHGQRRQLAHRVSWRVHRGLIVGGLSVLHKCDVRLCINPQHLFLGTRVDNNADMIAKGRLRPGKQCGEMNGHAILIEDEVLEIIGLRGTGARGVAKRFSVSPSAVTDIWRGHTWRHLQREGDQ